MKRIFSHWKTSLAGVFVAVFTAMLWMEKIDMMEFATGIGTIISIGALFSRDDPFNEAK